MQPSILIVCKFFDHSMEGFSFRSICLQGAVYGPCVTEEGIEAFFESDLTHPFFFVSSLQLLALSKALHPVGSPVASLT